MGEGVLVGVGVLVFIAVGVLVGVGVLDGVGVLVEVPGRGVAVLVAEGVTGLLVMVGVAV